MKTSETVESKQEADQVSTLSDVPYEKRPVDKVLKDEKVSGKSQPLTKKRRGKQMSAK